MYFPFVSFVSFVLYLLWLDEGAGCDRSSGDDRWRKTETIKETAVDVETDDDDDVGCCCSQSDGSESEAGTEDGSEDDEGDEEDNVHRNDQVVMEAMGVSIRRRRSPISQSWKFIKKYYQIFQRAVKNLVEHKYFQQALLGAILVNTLSMGIEYHNQVPFRSTHSLKQDCRFLCFNPSLIMMWIRTKQTRVLKDMK